MHHLRTVVILGTIFLHLLLGLRGFGEEGVDFFTMKPFSDPFVQCSVQVSREEGGHSVPLPFPSHTYRQIPSLSFRRRLYLEALPLYARGLEETLQRTTPDARAEILCQTVHPPAASFHS